MKTPIRYALVLTAALALQACSGGNNNNSSPPPVPPAVPPATPPPAVTPTAFTAFVLGLIAQTSDTATPVDINAIEFTFSEDPNAFNGVLGGP
ncbi:MAG: hypothetical protein ABIP49_08960 [Lysobacterales bacterium]